MRHQQHTISLRNTIETKCPDMNNHLATPAYLDRLDTMSVDQLRSLLKELRMQDPSQQGVNTMIQKVRELYKRKLGD